MTITRADKLKGVRYLDMPIDELTKLSQKISTLLSSIKACKVEDREKVKSLFDQVHSLGFVSLSDMIEMLSEINILIDKSS